MNSSKVLLACVVLAGCATQPAPQIPCAPVTVVQNTACDWVQGVRPTRHDVDTADADTLRQIKDRNDAFQKNCPAQYATWKASLGPWK